MREVGTGFNEVKYVMFYYLLKQFQLFRKAVFSPRILHMSIECTYPRNATSSSCQKFSYISYVQIIRIRTRVTKSQKLKFHQDQASLESSSSMTLLCIHAARGLKRLAFFIAYRLLTVNRRVVRYTTVRHAFKVMRFSRSANWLAGQKPTRSAPAKRHGGFALGNSSGRRRSH